MIISALSSNLNHTQELPVYVLLIRPRALGLLAPQLHHQHHQRIRRDAEQRRDASLSVARVSKTVSI